MRRFCAGFGTAVLMWAELIGVAESGWRGSAVVVACILPAALVTPVAFVAGMVRGR